MTDADNYAYDRLDLPAWCALAVKLHPTPWRTQESWSGREVRDANDMLVLRIGRGRTGGRIQDEIAVAALIASSVNAAYGDE